MINQQLVQNFQLAPEHNNPEYTIFLRTLVMQYDYNEILNQFIPIIEDEGIQLKIRFSAYYSCSIFFRRNNKFEEMVELANKYSQYFIQYPLNNIYYHLLKYSLHSVCHSPLYFFYYTV